MIRSKTVLGSVAYLMPVFSLGLLFYIWNVTNPATVGPAGVLLVFIVLYVFWASLFFIAIHTLLRFMSDRLPKLLNPRRNHVRPRQAYYIASILAFAPVLILAMQSVNQLTMRDVLLVALFISLAIFYVLKRS